MTEDAASAEDLDRLAQTFIEQARRGETPSIEAVALSRVAVELMNQRRYDDADSGRASIRTLFSRSRPAPQEIRPAATV